MVGLTTKLVIGCAAGYGLYVAYVHVRTQREISLRREAAAAAAAATATTATATATAAAANQYALYTLHGRFENPFPEYRLQLVFEFAAVRLLEVWHWLHGVFGGVDELRLLHKDIAKLRQELPVYSPNWQAYATASALEMVFTWLGQLCALVKIAGLTFLTDPLFETFLINRTLGPQRITPLPAPLADVPAPNYVLVLHNHPDHLEDSLIEHIRNSAQWIVPLGVGNHLRRKGVHNLVEMDWWDRYSLALPPGDSATYEVVCVPAMHWSGRTVVDSNHTLWALFVVMRNGKAVFYHAGDTGYLEGMFAEIKRQIGPVLLGMLPIGQYCPEWHQKPRHILPLESVTIAKTLPIAHMVGVHWGTFKLSSESVLEPKEWLERAADEEGKTGEWVPGSFGQTVVYKLE